MPLHFFKLFLQDIIMLLRDKYAPTSLADVIYPNSATQMRVNAYVSGAFSGNIIFHGSNGTGKSSVANLLPYAIDGMDAHVETKSFDELMEIKDLNGYIKRLASIVRISQGSKYFLVMHEMDNLKGRADKLWTAIDDVAADIMLIITTNEPAKIHKSLSSRCKIIEFPAISPSAFLARAQYILKAEGVHMADSDVLGHLQEQARTGDMRRYFDVLDDLVFLQLQGIPAPKPVKPKKPPLRVV